MKHRKGRSRTERHRQRKERLKKKQESKKKKLRLLVEDEKECERMKDEGVSPSCSNIDIILICSAGTLTCHAAGG